MLENGINVDSLQRHLSFVTYDSHVLFALRFMIDCSIVGGNWVELKVRCFPAVQPPVPCGSVLGRRHGNFYLRMKRSKQPRPGLSSMLSPP